MDMPPGAECSARLTSRRNRISLAVSLQKKKRIKPLYHRPPYPHPRRGATPAARNFRRAPGREDHVFWGFLRAAGKSTLFRISR